MRPPSIAVLSGLALFGLMSLSGCTPFGATTATVRVAPVDQRPAQFTPQRQSATTMAVWLAAWEDQRGDLHAPATVYVEVDPTTWSYGDGATSARYSVLRPLQVEARVVPERNPALPMLPGGPSPTPLPMQMPPNTGRRGA